MIPIVFDIDKVLEDGFGCYIKGRSYDLEENGCVYDPELAIKYYKRGYYEFNDILCQYSIAISNYLGDFKDLLTVDDKKIEFPMVSDIEKLITSDNDIQSIYAKFVLAAYYNYGLAGITKDEDKAFLLILECAKCGHVGAMYDLGAKEKFKSRIDNASDYLTEAFNNGSNRARKILEKVNE